MLINGYADSFLVLKKGEIIFEEYFNGMSQESLHLLNSISKNFTGMLTGVIVKLGLINVDEKVINYLPKLKDSAFNETTVRQVLDMTAAVKYDEDYNNPTTDFWQETSAVGWSPSLLNENSSDLFNYALSLKDKEQKVKKLRQSYYVIKAKDNKIILLKNDGELMSFQIENTGIKIQTNHYTENINQDTVQLNKKTYLPLPIKIGSKWNEQDKTTLKLKLGYDRVYNSNLPVDITNEIIGEEYIKLKNGTKILCLKIQGFGETSFIPGPPLGKIGIKVETELWLSKNYGLVKYIRKEKSDSVTMGEILYEKTLILE